MTQALTRDTVAAYLGERGLIAPDEAPEVAEVGRTHSVFRVDSASGALFVKQPGTTLASHYEACRREASLYALAAHDEILRRLTPPLAHHDARCGVLVTRGRPDAVSFSTLAREEGQLPQIFEERLAEALARHHSRALDPYVMRAAGFEVDRQCPVVLTLGHARPDIWVRFGPIGPQVAALLRRRPPLARLFNDAQNDWRADTLIHGDLGFENIVLHPRDAASPWIYFIDWEMTCRGDAAWDLATVVRPALVASMAPRETAVEFGALRAVGSPSPGLAPSIRFWRTYARARGWDGARALDELRRVVRLAAIQIAWSIVEASRRSPKFDIGVIHAVERALNVALDPGQAMHQFDGA